MSRNRAGEAKNAYYHSAEYKRLQRLRKAEREGRADYVPGRGKKAGMVSAQRALLGAPPTQIGEGVWRRIEVQNAKDAWAHWLKIAPAWWLTQAAKARHLHERIGDRVRRATRRARKKTQADGTLSNADLARMISGAKVCMWCGVAVTLPVHKRYEPTMATIEHIVPLCQGGLHSKENVGIACAKCNYSRSKRAA